MALLLNIETTTETASVCLTKDGLALSARCNHQQKEHASFIHLAIAEVLCETQIALSHIDAIAVTSGPGSYTGIRVGLATAKGLCYALEKPLITINTLEVMAVAAIRSLTLEQAEGLLFCPMIDARRMEVFTAVFDFNLRIILEPSALILTNDIFSNILTNSKIIFFGSGSNKFKQIINNVNCSFDSFKWDSKHLGIIADSAFEEKKFSDISYCQPCYLKEFYTTV